MTDSTGDKFFGRYTIFGVDGEYDLPYMTRYWFGRLRLHIFHRGDNDPDPHDHPWDFWTFPLTSYVEEVIGWHPDGYSRHRQIVRAFRLHYRPATHTHRVLGRWTGAWELNWNSDNVDFTDPVVRPGKIVTLVWRGGGGRPWGFLKNRDGQWCWVPWKKYIYGGGKHGPCE